MRLTFRSKLLAIVGIAAVALVLLAIASEIIAKRVEQQLSAIQDRHLPRLVLRPELDASFERLRRGFQDAVAAHDLEGLSNTRQMKQHLLEQLTLAGSAVEPAEGAALRKALEEYDGAAYDVSLRLIKDETGEPLVAAMAAMQAKQIRVTEALDKATALDGHELSEAFADAARAETSARKYRILISVACLIAVLAFSQGLSRSVVRSVETLTAGLRRFGAGHFDQSIEIVSRDELGNLAEQANQMASDLEQAGAERRRADERFRMLIESAPDAMVIVRQDGRVALVNAQTERLFGFTREELIDHDVEVLVPERFRNKDRGNGAGYLGASTVGPIGSTMELFGLRKDGGEFPIEISASPLETDEGVLVSCSIRDTTERKRIETALKTSNRELEAFSYSVAHDLRAPLRGINGLSRAVLEDAGDKLEDDAKDYLQRIGAASERMGLLIDALLALSRVSRVELQRESVNLTRVAEATANQLRLGQPGRSVDFAIQENLVAHGDTALLRALFDNLFGNAWKFTGATESARVEFGGTQKEGTTVYHVRDNGAGFDMEYADKLFAPFQRLHAATEFAGTGIGLATVQRIVRRHGGEIWADGAIGRGATFYFTLQTAKPAGGTSS